MQPNTRTVPTLLNLCFHNLVERHTANPALGIDRMMNSYLPSELIEIFRSRCQVNHHASVFVLVGRRQFTLQLTNGETISQVKQKIATLINSSPSQFRLCIKIPVEPHFRIRDYGFIIGDSLNIFVLLNLGLCRHCKAKVCRH